MENTFWTALGASFPAALVTSMGIYVIRRFCHGCRCFCDRDYSDLKPSPQCFFQEITETALK
jgi:hypothetical protein